MQDQVSSIVASHMSNGPSAGKGGGPGPPLDLDGSGPSRPRGRPTGKPTHPSVFKGEPAGCSTSRRSTADLPFSGAATSNTVMSVGRSVGLGNKVELNLYDLLFFDTERDVRAMEPGFSMQDVLPFIVPGTVRWDTGCIGWTDLHDSTRLSIPEIGVDTIENACIVHFFTDGSAYWSNEANDKIAGWGVTTIGERNGESLFLSEWYQGQW